MSKKLLFLISFVLVLSLTTSALAYDTIIWDNENGAGNRLWQTATNWDIDKVPEAPDWAGLGDTFVDEANGPIINADTNAVCEWLDFGYEGDFSLPVYGNAVLTMTGGSLTAYSYITMINNDADGNAVFNMSGGNVKIWQLSGTAFNIGEEGAGIATFNLSDGVVDVNGIMCVGWWGSLAGKTIYGIVNMSGGTINIVDDLIVGEWEQAEGTINISAGAITVGDWLEIGGWTADRPGNGHINLQGGTITAHFLSMGGGGVGTMNLAGGTLIIDGDYRGTNGWLFDPENDTAGDGGDYTGTIAILAQRGLITVYDSNVGDIITDVNYPAQVGLRAVLNLDYDVTNPGQTTITAGAVDPNLAWNPNPLNGAGGLVASDVIQISWSAGDNAASHDVYFGTSFAEVSDANTSSGEYKGPQGLSDVNYPVSVIWDKDYYWRIDEVNASKVWEGAVWSFATMPAFATNPNPDDGEEDVYPPLVLTWTVGPEADTHELYFSTDYNDVNDRLVTPATPGANSYSPGVFEFSTTYYWAVDEVNDDADVNVWPGEVWSFTTTDHLVVDDFESYANTEPDLYAVWDDYAVNDSGAAIGLITDPDFVRDGNNSIIYDYDNADYKVGSVIDADTADLDIGSNWSIGGAKVLVLYFAGQPGNSATAGDRMWVELEDTSTNKGVAIYDGDPNDVTEEPWHEWAIDMGVFDACGVSLANVDKIHIGFGGTRGEANKQKGGTGTVYFDTIEVWPPYCRSELVTADISGDCVTDINDLEVLSDDWLLYDYNFIAAEPCEANLIGWWKFDEGLGTTTADSSAYGNDGNIIEASWTSGHPGDPYDSALDFDGDGVVTEEYVVCALRDGNGPGTYPAELMPDKFTVSCWAKLDSFEYFSSFVGNGMDEGSNECGFFFYNWGWIGPVGPDFGLAIRTEAGMYYVETENIYDTKTWYHLAASYDGNYASVYVDGLLAAGPTDVGGPIRWISDSSGNYPQNFTIGVWLDPGYSLFVNGIIDEVRYYNLPLSQGDIAVLAGLVTPGEEMYQPVPSLANITDPEAKLSRKVNFMDYAILADDWLEGPILWPSP